MYWYVKFLDRFEGRGAWAFDPLFFVSASVSFASALMAMHFVLGMPSFSAGFAASGAFGACCGVMTIGRPMIRKGGYRKWHEEQIRAAGASITEPSEEEKNQLIYDAISVQVIGPSLLIVWTLLNGFSGFYG